MASGHKTIDKYFSSKSATKFTPKGIVGSIIDERVSHVLAKETKTHTGKKRLWQVNVFVPTSVRHRIARIRK